MGPVRIKSQSPQGRFQECQDHSLEIVEREGRAQAGGAGRTVSWSAAWTGPAKVGLDVHGPPAGMVETGVS